MVDDVENPTSSAADEEENGNIKDGAPTSNFQVVTTVPTNEEDDNVHDNVNDDIENPIPPVATENLVSEKVTDNNNDSPTTSQTQNEIEVVKRNINSYYGHKVGAISTISLILNAGLMIYAHRKLYNMYIVLSFCAYHIICLTNIKLLIVGLSAVILSSRDPSLTAGIIRRTSQQQQQQQQQQSRTLQAELEPKCNSNDLQNWVTSGGETSRPIKSNYCSREYNGGCFLDSTCIEICFVEEHGYSEECSVCFGRVPVCSIDNGCLLSWYVHV